VPRPRPLDPEVIVGGDEAVSALEVSVKGPRRGLLKDLNDGARFWADDVHTLNLRAAARFLRTRIRGSCRARGDRRS